MNVSDWMLIHGGDLQVALFFAFLLLIGVAERLFPLRPGAMDRDLRWPANLGLTLVNLATLGVLPVSMIGAALWAESRTWGLLNNIELPVGIAIAVTLLMRGFVSFFAHYLMHKVPLFWRVHRVHHLDTELDVSSTVRFHPIEFVIQTVPGVLIAVASGLTPWVLVLYELLDVVVTLWTHSNLRLPERIDCVIRYVVVTPSLHRIHHSAWQPETDSNFGAVFPIWDLIFGTYRSMPREDQEHMRLGLDEVRGPDAHRLLWLLGSVRDARLVGVSTSHAASDNPVDAAV